MRGISFGGRDVPQFVLSNSTLPTIPPSSTLQLQRLNQLIRSPSTKHRASSNVDSRPTRQRSVTSPSTSSEATTQSTMSYAGIMQTNTRSTMNTYPSSTLTSSSTTTTEISLTVERRFVQIETTIREQKLQQDEMSIKLDSVDATSTESNQLIKQLLDEMKIGSRSASGQRSKRGKTDKSGEVEDDSQMPQSDP